MKDPAVPVIMHHSIGVVNKNWRWNHLTCPYGIFEDQLKWLKKKNFHTISLQQLYEYMKNGSKLPENPIALSFDDGYLDNWTYAYPLLKKYSFKGTIFVSPEFVDPTGEYRPNLEDVWRKKTEMNQLKNTGFLSWREMEEMENEKIIDIQSHALTHTWHFNSNKIIDFRHPGDEYIWMTWNDNPDKKPYLQMDNKELIDYGAPVYEHGKSLEVMRYFPDENLTSTVIEYVKENGGEIFFRNNWRAKLLNIVEDYRKNHRIEDRYETDIEYANRVRKELKKSKEIIEDRLNKEVKFLCWPGGGTNESILKITAEVGYISSNYSRKEIQGKKLWNKFGEDPSRIKRKGTVLYWNGRANCLSRMKYQNGFLFFLSLSDFQKKKIKATLRKALLAGIRRIYEIRLSV